jgi:hypothetical protein
VSVDWAAAGVARRMLDAITAARAREEEAMGELDHGAEGGSRKRAPSPRAALP